jgi:hypothetical protein
MLELAIVEHCAPTLAGLKSANLFNYGFSSFDNLSEELLMINHKLNGKGVYVEILRQKEGRALVYVYRKKKLAEEMNRPGVTEFLQTCGCENCEQGCCVEYLKSRLMKREEFPHEIGLFLGYPLGDVKGFIEYKGRNCKFCGFWKVYCNENETRRLFEKYKKCTSVYCRQFANGRSIAQLTVAA